MVFWRSLLILSVLALGGCVTLGSLKDGIVQQYNSVAGYFEKKVDPVEEEKKKLPVYDGTCPSVAVRPDLIRLVDFYSESNPSPDNVVSEATITRVSNICRIENNSLVMQIDFELDGKTGPKARQKPKDQPNFAYPYFVAVTDAQGNVLFKELFAATIAYGREENEKIVQETIFQNMPFPDSAAGEVYHVIIGFQLNEMQLAYSTRSAATPPTHN
jgi:hypothetical protein